MRQNTLDELQRPLTEPRTTSITQSYSIHRDAKRYRLSTRPALKDYKLVYSKRTLDPTTYVAYPFGYAHADAWEAEDTVNVDA